MYPHTLIPTPFFANFLLCFILLLMNSSTSGLKNGYSLAKNFLSFKEAVAARFTSFFWFHSLYFGFTYSIGDALRSKHLLICVLDIQGKVYSLN